MSQTQKRRKIISYEEFGNLMDRLVEKLKPIANELSFVHGISRGGIGIALHLSHQLDLEIICEHSLLMGGEISQDEILIVDDLTDSGNTLESFKQAKPNIRTATLFHKPHSSITPDFYLEETSDWVVFPWEDPNEEPNREGYEGV